MNIDTEWKKWKKCLEDDLPQDEKERELELISHKLAFIGGWNSAQQERAADKPSAPQAWSPCSQCGSMGYCTHRDPAYR